MSNRVFTAFLVLCLAALACNLPSSNGVAGQTTQPATEVATEIVLQTDTPVSIVETPTETATPTQTSTQPAPEPHAATATNTSLPCNQASFVSDVTIPDGAEIEINKSFTKTWRLKNVGTCAWTSGYALVFENGDQMGGPASQALTNATVAPNETLDVSVALVAPNAVGTYHGNWKIREPGGTLFGLSTGAFWVEIKAVPQAPPPIPNWPVYKQGSSGPEVYAIQYLLRLHGQNPSPDGIFGPQTLNAVTAFQTQEGLTADGIVSAKTWNALIKGATVSQGDTGEVVRAVQILLKDKFGFSITVDGVFGPNTAAAVNDFQDQYSLATDRIVGSKTWQALIGY